MKNWNFWLCALLGLTLIYSCREDEHLILEGTQASELKGLAKNEFVLEEPSGSMNPLVFTLNWSPTTFNLSGALEATPAGPVSYEIELSKKGEGFSEVALLASTTNLYAHILTKELNQILLSEFAADPDEPLELELRVVAYYGENKTGRIESVNTQELVVSVYKPLQEVPKVYLLGDMNGWNNTNTDFIFYRNSNSLEDKTYTYTGRLAAGTYYKFIPEESLGTYKAYTRKDEASLGYEETDGGAFFNESERYVTITINTEQLTYSIEDYDVTGKQVFSTLGPIGGFTNWDNEPPLTRSAYDPHQWSGVVEITMATALKFRAEKNWAYNWGATAEDYPYGKAVFDGPGANIAVPGTYKIHFNDLTGHYVIIKQ